MLGFSNFLEYVRVMFGSERRSIRFEMALALQRKDRKRVVDLIDAGFPIDHPVRHGTLFFYAYMWNDPDLVRMLLARGGSLGNARNRDCVLYGVEHQNCELLEMALQARLDPNWHRWTSLSPLDEAVSNNDLKAIALLVKYGADASSLTHVRWWTVAPATAKLLKENGFVIDPRALND